MPGIRLLAAASALALALCAGESIAGGGAAALATALVTSGEGEPSSFDCVVEAVRQTVVAAQVSGAIVALDARVGDTVRAGQVLVRIDARASEQNVAASEAQVRSAQATLDVATRDFDRQKQLFEKNYTSKAALEHADAQFKATRARVAAELAQAGAARAQSGYFVVRAPYGGVISEVPVALGDMAMPGRPLLTIYDPAALRVTASVPQSELARLPPDQPVEIEFPGIERDRQSVAPANVTRVPATDPGTHTGQIRIGLPTAAAPVAPGTFARALLPLRGTASPRLYVPGGAIVRRAEMTGVYVLDPNGRAVLRQVRLGRAVNGSVEVLAGVSAGERVAVDPQAAARAH